MEDYAGAHHARRQDVEALLACVPARTTAAAHLGGVTIECRLKAILVDYHQLSNWNDISRRPRDPLSGQSIARPGHGLLSTLRQIDAIYRKARTDRLMLIHLNRVMHPSGATVGDFIDLRYASAELEGQTLADWRNSLKYVLGWLQKNDKGTS
jgi:hypothetical protein